jgi:uncharacterized protein
VKKIIAYFVLAYLFVCGIIYFFQNQILFHEADLEQNFEYNFKTSHKELWLKTEDNVNINALYFKTDTAKVKGLIVYLHGNADNLARWGNYATDFTENNYDFLVIDYRGFGKSIGDFSEKGFIEDGKAAYKYAKTLFPENKIIVYGRSLGSGIATQIAAKNNPKMLVLETPYASIPDASLHYFPFLPFYKLYNYQFSTDVFIKQVKAPIHLFHGTADWLVYYGSSLKLCEILNKKPADILTTIPKGGHKNLPDFVEYKVALKKVLE